MRESFVPASSLCLQLTSVSFNQLIHEGVALNMRHGGRCQQNLLHTLAAPNSTTASKWSSNNADGIRPPTPSTLRPVGWCLLCKGAGTSLGSQATILGHYQQLNHSFDF